MVSRIATYKELTRMPVSGSGEPLVNLSLELKDCVCLYEKEDMLAYVGDVIWARKSLAEKLERVSKKLRERFPELKLKIVYGYRHPKIQQDYFLKQKNNLAISHQNLKDEDLNELTHEMVAYPEVAGHPTGGALDITITGLDGDLDMGTRIADFSDPEKIKTFSKSITEQQSENRKLLHDLMTVEGFAPFYGEWWHFSYGDKEWAWFYEKPAALYGQIEFQTKNPQA